MSTVPVGLGRGGWASHRLSDVGLPSVCILQGIVLGIGQAPPAATGGRSLLGTASAGHCRAGGSPVAGCHEPVVGDRHSTHASQTSLSTEARGLVCERENSHQLGSGVRQGGLRVPSGTCWRSMSCGMAPTIWMAIFTTSLGGGMAPAEAPAPFGTAPRPAAPQFRVAAASPPPGAPRCRSPRCPAPSPELTRARWDPPPRRERGDGGTPLFVWGTRPSGARRHRPGWGWETLESLLVFFFFFLCVCLFTSENTVQILQAIFLSLQKKYKNNLYI